MSIIRGTQLAAAIACGALLAGCSATAVQDAVENDDVAASPSTASRTVSGSWSYTGTALAGNGNTGFSGDSADAKQVSLWAPRGIARSADGSITYIADTWNNRVRQVDATGRLLTLAGDGDRCSSSSIDTCGDGGAGLQAQLSKPSAVAVTPDGKSLLIADTESNRIRQLDLQSGVIKNFAGTGDLGYSGDKGPATSAQLAGPLDVAFDSAGNVLIADTDNNRIRKVDPTGTITTIAGDGSQCQVLTSCGNGGPALSAQLATPSGVAFDPGLSRILIADTNSHSVRFVDSSGNLQNLVGTGQPGATADGMAGSATMLNRPHRVSVAPSGQIMISDTVNQRLVASSPTGDQAWQVGSTGLALNEPWATLISPTGMVVADAGLNRLLKLTDVTAPTFTWQECGPDRYLKLPQAGMVSDVLMLLPGIASLDVQAWGAPGGFVRENPYTDFTYGGRAGYATTEISADVTQYAVLIGCQGVAAAEVTTAGGGGGATALATLSGYLAGNPTGNVFVVAAGGGGSVGYKCLQQSGGQCSSVNYPSFGGQGGVGDGVQGQSYAQPIQPGVATGGGGDGTGGAAATGAPANSAGTYGFGGPGGASSTGESGGWGPQWCGRACTASTPGAGGAGINGFAPGGGGGGGAGGGGGGYSPVPGPAEDQGFSGGTGGGSWAACVRDWQSPYPPQPPGGGENGAMIIKPSAAAAQPCKPGKIAPKPASAR